MKRPGEWDWELIREEAQTVGVLMIGVLNTGLFAANIVDPDMWFGIVNFLAAVVFAWWYGYRIGNRRWK